MIDEKNFELKNLNLAMWDTLTEQARKLRNDAYLSSGIVDFEKINNNLLAISDKRPVSPSDLLDKNYSNAYLYLLLYNENFSKKNKINDNMVMRIISTHNKIVRHSLLSIFIDIYFCFYDKLGKDASLIVKAIQKFIIEIKSSEFEKMGKNGNAIFSSRFDFHEKVISEAIQRNKDISSILDNYGLHIWQEGRFYEKVRIEYFIKRLEKANIDNCYSILEEIDKFNIFEKDYKNNFCLGHMVIHILLDKLSEKITTIKKYQNLINYILKKAGDPRNNQNTVLYQNCWLVLGDSDIARMKACLSGFDLELFLEIYNQFVIKTGRKDYKRMFEERKKFLQGMMMNNLIHETKLFIGDKMKDYVRRNYKISPIFYMIEDNAEMAVIYMKYGDMLFTEGAFNCKFRAYKDIQVIPINKNPLLNRRTSFSYRNLTEGFWELNYSLNPRNCFNKVHLGDWPNEVIGCISKWTNRNLINKYFYEGYGRSHV